LRAETDHILAHVISSKESENEIIDRAEAMAKRKGISMAQLATAWILSKDGIFNIE
jgi:aryl-alcohol dehydrogenase-like predicted oxidoreductase